jgi:hypothetical protein
LALILEIVARLKAQASALRSVGTAEDLAALAKGASPRDGDSFVIPFGETASPNQFATGYFRQHVVVQFLVAFIIRHAADAKGAERISKFDEYKASIEAAIAGWAPAEQSDPCTLISGRGSALGNGATVYVQTWQTTRNLEAS